MKIILSLFLLAYIQVAANLPHRVNVLKQKKDFTILSSLKPVYKDYTRSLLELQTDFVSSNRLNDSRSIQIEFSLNTGYMNLNAKSYQFVFDRQKPLPKEASIFRETRNEQIKFILKKNLSNYINELKNAQSVYLNNQNLIDARKATDEMRLATLELEKIQKIYFTEPTFLSFSINHSNNEIPSDAVEFKGNFYKVFKPNSTKSNFKNMRDRCLNMGGHLAYIETPEEHQFIYSLILSFVKTTDLGKLNYAFVGGSDAQQEGQWKWLNGEKINWFNWGNNEPGNHRPELEDFLGIQMDGTWCDASLYFKKHKYLFVCEWEGN